MHGHRSGPAALRRGLHEWTMRAHGPRHPGDWGGGMHGFGGFGTGHGPGGRRRRMRRGDVRAALLVLLSEQPHSGYSLMEELERRSNGAWRPSPGSVYPTLQQLEDEGLIAQEPGEGRTPYALTDMGKAYVEENREALGSPWEKPNEGIGEERLELRGLVAQIGAATFQVGMAGDDAQVTRAKELLAQTRRDLYRILADDESE